MFQLRRQILHVAKYVLYNLTEFLHTSATRKKLVSENVLEYIFIYITGRNNNEIALLVLRNAKITCICRVIYKYYFTSYITYDLNYIF